MVGVIAVCVRVCVLYLFQFNGSNSVTPPGPPYAFDVTPVQRRTTSTHAASGSRSFRSNARPSASASAQPAWIVNVTPNSHFSAQCSCLCAGVVVDGAVWIGHVRR